MICWGRAGIKPYPRAIGYPYDNKKRQKQKNLFPGINVDVSVQLPIVDASLKRQHFLNLRNFAPSNGPA
jgi:hypothetical protein